MTKRFKLLLVGATVCSSLYAYNEYVIDGVTYALIQTTYDSNAPVVYISDEVPDTLVIPDTVDILARKRNVDKFYTASSRGYVHMPDHVKSFSLPATFTSFYGCLYFETTGLERIVLADCSTPIELDKYTGTQNLSIKDVKIKEFYIGRYIGTGDVQPYWQSSLEKIEVGNDFASLKPGYFKDFACLETVTLGESMTTIDESLFEGCTSLTTINFNDRLETIGPRAFKGCTSLTSVVIPASVKTIDVSAFEGCTALKSVVLQGNTEIIGDSAFMGCTSLSSLSLSNNLLEIGDNAFESCSALDFVGIPASVQTIGTQAFKDCAALDYILMGSGVKSVGPDAFEGCDALTELEIDNLTSWCDVRLANEQSNPLFKARKLTMRGSEITNLTIPAGVETIRDYTFIGGERIQVVNIPESTTVIGKKAFSESGIGNLKTGANLNTIGEQAFASALLLKSIIFADAVNNLGEGAFDGCTALQTIDAGNGLGNIAAGAFAGCTALTAINITDIAGWATTTYADPEANPLYHARSLTLDGEPLNDLVVSDGAEFVSDYAFYNCESLKTVNTGNTVTTVGKQAFAGCAGLSQIVLADAVMTTGDEFAKDASALTTVFFGSNVKTIGGGMLTGCPEIKELIALMVPATLQTAQCFDSDVYSKASLYVPYDAYSTYRITQPWQGFRRIYEVGLSFDESAMGIEGGRKNIMVGETASLAVTAIPASLLGAVQWTTSDPDIVTVNDKGTITGIGEGNATITVEAGQNLRATCQVVVSKWDGVNDITVDNSTDVRIYNMQGVLVYTGDMSGADLENGLYIVVNGNKTTKIHIR